ncbi:MAG: guanine deaminase [Candidatus Cloacimonetes bacterium]|nr:guanine deaminase [Candidatus Cloacimonadota bacterium]
MTQKSIYIKTNILTPVASDDLCFRRNVYLEVSGSKISQISEDISTEDYIDYSNLVCLPGLIDIHVHLSQFYAIGRYSPDLLKWLNSYIFKAEAESSDYDFAKRIAKDFYESLLAHGTTTSVVYTSLFSSACEAAFEIAEAMGVRSIIGKTMMDVNSPDSLSETTEDSLRNSFELFEKWNFRNDLLEYVFTPRFAPVCSPKLMREVADFAGKNDAYIQSHLSENLNEIKWVKSLFPDLPNYTSVYNYFGLLSPKTIMAHCIHLTEDEIDLLKDTGCKVAHCPDSNFFLKSGIFPFETLCRREIKFGLATDVAAGTNLSMFNTMKMAIYMQKKNLVDPKYAFYISTLGNAELLGKDKLIGSVEAGKEADLSFWSVSDIASKGSDEILSELIFTELGNKASKVWIAGKELYSAN